MPVLVELLARASGRQLNNPTSDTVGFLAREKGFEPKRVFPLREKYSQFIKYHSHITHHTTNLIRINNSSLIY